jgi:hypothetical protein
MTQFLGKVTMETLQKGCEPQSRSIETKQQFVQRLT